MSHVYDVPRISPHVAQSPTHPGPCPHPCPDLSPYALPAPPPVPPGVVDRLRAAGCVFAEDEARLILRTARTPEEVESMARRRVAGLPLEQVVGWAEFRGLRISLDPGVFVPRRRTEFLVSQAVAHATGRRSAAREGRAGAVVVDLCCGSGAVGAALVAALGPRTALYAADVDPAAVRCARRNVADIGGRVYEGDLFAALPAALRGRVDVLAANVPYVPSDAVGLLPSEARDHEPLVALDGGTDGLDVLRRVAAGAREWLAPGGCVLVETSERQAAQAALAFVRGGLTARLTTSEELDVTVVVGTAPAAPPGRVAPDSPAAPEGRTHGYAAPPPPAPGSKSSTK